jgi:hypothetical protein
MRVCAEGGALRALFVDIRTTYSSCAEGWRLPQGQMQRSKGRGAHADAGGAGQEGS